MNNKLERLLQDVLSTSGSWDTEKAELVRREVNAMYENKLKLWRYIIWGLLAIDAVFIAAAVNVFAFSSNVKILIGSAAVALAALESISFIKLWYWQMNSKFSVLKEIAEMKLLIAEMEEKKAAIEE